MNRTNATDDAVTLAMTGASGYVGTALRPALSDRRPGWEVRAVDADVRDRDRVGAEVAGADVVVHLAAVSDIGACEANPERAYEVNVGGTANVAWACRETGAGLLFPSSTAVLGADRGASIPPDAVRRPRSWYGRTKALAEATVVGFADGAFPAHVLVQSNVYGRGAGHDGRFPGQSVVDVFVRRALAGDPLVVEGPGTTVRNFVHVADVVEAYCLSLDRVRDEDDGAFTCAVTGPDATSVTQLARLVSTVAAEFGVETAVERAPGQERSPPAGQSSRDGGALFAPATRTELGFEPERGVEEYVRETFRAVHGE